MIDPLMELRKATGQMGQKFPKTIPISIKPIKPVKIKQAKKVSFEKDSPKMKKLKQVYKERPHTSGYF